MELLDKGKPVVRRGRKARSLGGLRGVAASDDGPVEEAPAEDGAGGIG